jgi:hypothetical protein
MVIPTIMRSFPWMPKARPPYPESQVYLNSGTWHSYYDLAIKNPLEQKFLPYQALTYLTFYKDDEREGRNFEAWSGNVYVDNLWLNAEPRPRRGSVVDSPQLQGNLKYGLWQFYELTTSSSSAADLPGSRPRCTCTDLPRIWPTASCSWKKRIIRAPSFAPGGWWPTRK